MPGGAGRHSTQNFKETLMGLCRKVSRSRLCTAMLWGLVTLMVVAIMPGKSTADVVIVQDGNAEAVIVISDDATPTAKYAAEELVEHIKQATGAELLITAESEIPEDYRSRIYVGTTESARSRGINPDELAWNQTVLKIIGNDLYVLGSERHDAEPVSVYNIRSGTLFGVYELLERYIGVVWAWPGELGRYIPRAKNIVIADDLDEIYSPKLKMRMVGGDYAVRAAKGSVRYDSDMETLAFSRDGLKAYAQAIEVYLRRHRMQRGIGASAGHEFSTWWGKHGKRNPEWFMADEDGNRGTEASGGLRPEQVAMCVSNPDLHQHLVTEAIGLWKQNGTRNIRLGESDTRHFCWCERCLSWDGQQVSKDQLPEFLQNGPYTPRVTSDRYAKFWKTIYEMAAEVIPDPTVTTYLYFNYMPAPSEGIELSPNIWGYFTPWSGHETVFFPMRPEALQWVKEQWKGWADTGMSMVYRPNYLHDGWTMPMMDTRQSGEMFKHAYANGMQGAWFDTLCGQWASQGPKLYMHMRLLAKPEMEIDDILDEYYSVFGPAAKDVRAYFEYWEQYAIDNQQKMVNALKDLGSSRWRRFNLKAHEVFPLESFSPAEAILERASQAALDDGNGDFVKRVRFVQAGLEHAKLSVKLAAAFNGERQLRRTSEQFKQAHQALSELVRFRKKHERLFIFDFAYTASKELRADNWNLRAMMAGGLSDSSKSAGTYLAHIAPLLNSSDQQTRHAGRRIAQRILDAYNADDREIGPDVIKALEDVYQASGRDVSDAMRYIAFRMLLLCQDDESARQTLLAGAAKDENQSIREFAFLVRNINLESSTGRQLLSAINKDDSIALSEMLFQQTLDVNESQLLGDDDLRVPVVAEVRVPKTNWKFQKDQYRTGHLRLWMAADLKQDSRWREMQIESAWGPLLGEQYVGAGWYRRTISVPPLRGYDVLALQFEGVDESTWAWIDGRFAGAHDVGPTGWNKQFAFNVTNLIEPGREHLLTVRVMNTRANGGIWKPVRLLALGSATGN